MLLSPVDRHRLATAPRGYVALRRPLRCLWCNVCNIGQNGFGQLADHLRQKRHRHTRRGVRTKSTSAHKLPIVIPEGTAVLIEQTALLADAVQHYIMELFRRAAIRAKL